MSLTAQKHNWVAPPFNSTTWTEPNTSQSSKQDHGISGWNPNDTVSENVLHTLQSRYKALIHSPVLKVETHDGQRYVGSIKGISFWDGYSNLPFTTDNSGIPENNITALAVDDQNNLWIGTNSKGIVKGFGKSFKPYKTKTIPTHDLNIYSIVSAGNGDVWVTYQDGGFEYFQNGVSEAYFPSPKTK